MVNASADEAQTSVRTLLHALAPYPNFILSTGCDLPPETPLENIEAFMAAGKEWKKAG
jgi:uroporphyrinogen decarboxylase